MVALQKLVRSLNVTRECDHARNPSTQTQAERHQPHCLLVRDDPGVLFADSSICSLKPSYQSRKAANRICIPCVRLWWSMHSREFELIIGARRPRRILSS